MHRSKINNKYLFIKHQRINKQKEPAHSVKEPEKIRMRSIQLLIILLIEVVVLYPKTSLEVAKFPKYVLFVEELEPLDK
jgi:hypothetical protein